MSLNAARQNFPQYEVFFRKNEICYDLQWWSDLLFWSTENYCDDLENNKYVNLQFSRSSNIMQKGPEDSLMGKSPIYLSMTLALDSNK